MNRPADHTVVLVDDDASVRASMARLFRSAGLELRTFASGEEFLSAADALAGAACLIADVQMPGMRGLELQAECARHNPSLPVILITAFEDPAAQRDALAAGALAFLYKPFDGEVLLDLVRRALDGHGQAATRSNVTGHRSTGP